jgi:methionine sulfoxide reductase heme-binding subunit
MNNQVVDRKAESQRFQLKVLSHVIGLLPLILLIGAYVRGELGFNPVEAVIQKTGKTALIFLLLSLANTPVRRLLRISIIGQLRKPFGLYAALYAVIHFLAFTVWDYGFNLPQIWEEIGTKPFIILGLIALLILIVLAVTSFRKWQQEWGKRWIWLHRLTYLAGILVIVHYLMSVKGNLFRLEGNYTLPLVLGGILLVLLFLRLPFVVKWLRPGSGTKQENQTKQI